MYQKAERLSELLKEANSLADELASKGNITLSVEVEEVKSSRLFTSNQRKD